jgi:hypothetical protein
MPFDIGGFIYNSQHADNQDYKNIIKTGLVLHLDASALESYPGSGTSWYDMSANNNHSTLVNGATYNSSNQGSIVLDGADDYVAVGSFMSYNTFSILLWVNPGSTQNTYADIFDNNHTGTQNFVCQQNVNNLNQYEFSMIGASTYSATGLFTLSANTWTFLSFTFDGSVARAYINGALNGTGGSMTPNYVSPYFRLGCWAGFGSLARFWNGKYGNCMLYNRRLSTEEILQTYNVQKGRFGL